MRHFPIGMPPTTGCTVLAGLALLSSLVACGSGPPSSREVATGPLPDGPSATPTRARVAPPVLNLCAENHGGCIADAVCTDVPFGVVCTCGEGFVGDGMTCVPRGSPFTHTTTFFKASPAHGHAWFGQDVALSGDGSTLAVTEVYARSEEENANLYLYVRVADAWALQQVIELAPESGEPGPASASHVVLSADGDTLAALVSTPYDQGSVHVFGRVGGTWARLAELRPGEDEGGGWGMALSGDGASLAISMRTGVQIRTRANGWAQVAMLSAGDAGGAIPSTPEDGFGVELALSFDGGVLIAGAPNRDRGTYDVGAAYVFRRTDSRRRPWVFDALLEIEDGARDDHFGSAVALSRDGTRAAVGAHGRQTVVVFNRARGAWAREAALVSRLRDGALGETVSLSGDGNVLAAGARGDSSAGNGVGCSPGEGADGSGAVVVFRRDDGGTWAESLFIKATNTGAQDYFGTSVALSADGTTIAVGAPEEDSGTMGIDVSSDEESEDSGAAYVYR